MESIEVLDFPAGEWIHLDEVEHCFRLLKGSGELYAIQRNEEGGRIFIQEKTTGECLFSLDKENDIALLFIPTEAVCLEIVPLDQHVSVEWQAWLEQAERFSLELSQRFAINKNDFIQKLDCQEVERNLLVKNSFVELMKNMIPRLPFVAAAGNYNRPPLLTLLQIIGEYYGLPKRRFYFGEKYTPDSDLVEIMRAVAAKAGLYGRKIKLSEGWYEKDHGPLLIFLDGNQVALLPIGPKKYELINPKMEERRVFLPADASHAAEEAYTFYVGLPDTIQSFWDVLRWSFRQCFQNDVWILFWTCILAGAIPMITPLITQSVFSDIIPSYDKQAHLMVVQVMLVTVVAGGLINLVRSVAVLRMKNKVRSVAESGLWLRLLSLPLSFFRRYQVGDLAMRMQTIGRVSSQLSTAISNGLFNGIFSFWNLLVMLYYDYRLTIVALIVWAVYLVLSGFFSWKLVTAQQEKVEASGDIAGQSLQLLNGLTKFRIAAAEERAFYLWAKKFGREWRANRHLRWQRNWLELIGSIQPLILNFFIFWLVIYWIDIDLRSNSVFFEQADFLAFNSAMGSFGASISGLIPALTTLWSVKPSIRRMEPVLIETPEVDEYKQQAGELSGRIEVCDVNFRYGPDRPWAVKNVSLCIEQGQFIGIVGSSGSGKTTLLRLLLGLERAEKGVILYDDQDLGEMNVASVRRQMGVVMQNGRIMSGSIYSNIIGSLPLTIEDAWKAAEMVGFANDIKEMPMGMHTVVSEGGGNISGGQKQRLLIARSIVHHPHIIVFDEATSALDNRTQAIVSETLASLRATRIVVAHRLTTIKDADMILVMNQGEIVEMGKYDDLMRHNGLFAELAKRQVM